MRAARECCEPRSAEKKWGPASLPAPTAPSEGSAGVRSTLDPAPENRLVTPLLDPGSPAQASHPTEPLPLARSLIDLLDCAARRFAGLSTFPARRLEPRFLEAKTVQCSAALLGSTTLASRFAHQRSEDLPGAASRLRKIDSSGASSRLARDEPESSSHSCRRRSGLWPPAAPSCRFRLLGRPGPQSRSPKHHAPPPRVAKAKSAGLILWKTGISGTIGGTFSPAANRPRFGCRSVLLRLLAPSA
jgi:hypothetical protein